MSKQDYVLGFAFDDTPRVALIKKNRPEWMAGKWNGIGGKIEVGEDATAAMVREFQEEAGVSSAPEVWTHFVTLEEPAARIFCFVVLATREDLDLITTMESEEVALFGPERMAALVEGETLMVNLPWLIPMAVSLNGVDSPLLIVSGNE